MLNGLLGCFLRDDKQNTTYNMLIDDRIYATETSLEYRVQQVFSIGRCDVLGRAPPWI